MKELEALITTKLKGLAIEFYEYLKKFKPVANGQPDLYQHPTIRKVMTIDEILESFLKDKYKK